MRQMSRMRTDRIKADESFARSVQNRDIRVIRGSLFFGSNAFMRQEVLFPWHSHRRHVILTERLIFFCTGTMEPSACIASSRPAWP
jgi:hypothetical protein